MKLPLPDSIAGRTILVLLVGLTVSHLLSTGIYHRDLLTALGMSGDMHVAERVATIARTVAGLPTTERENAAHAASNTTLEAHWDEAPAVQAETKSTEGLSSHLNSMLPAFQANGLRSVSGADSMPGHGSSTLLLSLPLEDGSWINFRLATPHVSTADSQHLLISTSLMAVAVLLFSGMLVRILTAPLRDLSRAAERLGVDMTAPPLAESGPREVRQAARAFNNMQQRIKRLVTDRTQMLAAISHDLRTPITRLRLRAEFVEEAEQRTKMMADLQEMEAMISSTLAFLREDSDREEARVISVDALLETICDDMTDAGNDVRFEAEERVTLRCRQLSMKRAFTNLIDNAVKYGGQAAVTLSNEPGMVRVDIDDAGPGIPEDLHEKVFTPFFRAEQSRNRGTGGTGLGLTVARSVVRAHGGDIELCNSPANGLRVTVRIPQAA
jgi:signal transduction histidine kinase